MYPGPDGGGERGGGKPNRQRQGPKPERSAAELAAIKEQQERNRLTNIKKREEREAKEKEGSAAKGKAREKAVAKPAPQKLPEKTPAPKPKEDRPIASTPTPKPKDAQPAVAPKQAERAPATKPDPALRPAADRKAAPAQPQEKQPAKPSIAEKEEGLRDYMKEAKALAEEVIELEPLHEKFLATIEEHGLTMRFPRFFQFWKQGHILGGTVEEAEKIRRIAAPQGVSEKFGVWAAGLWPGGKGARFKPGGMIKIEAKQIDIITRYRDWLKTRVGTIEKNSPEPAGIERLIVEALGKLDAETKKVLEGLTINLEGSSSKEGAAKAWIVKNEKRREFRIKKNVAVDDIVKAIRNAPKGTK